MYNGGRWSTSPLFARTARKKKEERKENMVCDKHVIANALVKKKILISYESLVKKKNTIRIPQGENTC